MSVATSDPARVGSDPVRNPTPPGHTVQVHNVDSQRSRDDGHCPGPRYHSLALPSRSSASSDPDRPFTDTWAWALAFVQFCRSHEDGLGISLGGA